MIQNLTHLAEYLTAVQIMGLSLEQAQIVLDRVNSYLATADVDETAPQELYNLVQAVADNVLHGDSYDNFISIKTFFNF
jgi:hypothetical protein